MRLLQANVTRSGSDHHCRGFSLLLHARRELFPEPSFQRCCIPTLTLFLAYCVKYPETATFLTESERRHIVALLAEDSKNLAKDYDHKYFWQAVKDYKSWLQIVVYIGYSAVLLRGPL